MAIAPPDSIEVKRVKGKGRGVFARRLIRSGEVIEQAPLLVLRLADVQRDDEWTELGTYCFNWGRGTVALVLGYGSLYNHSYLPNARHDDVAPRTKVFSALRDIAPGEEITVNYCGEPDDRSPVWFEVIESTK